MSPRPPPRWVAWTETLALATATPLVGLAVQPRDPFFIQGGFSWTGLAPVLAGLRYGFVHGLGCALALLLALCASIRLGLPWVDQIPAQLGFGLLVLGMIAGEFRDLWSRRLQQATRSSHQARARLDEFSRAYHLLRASHEKLEQRLAGGTPSLREMLTCLRDAVLAARATSEPLLGLSPTVLELFVNHGGVQAACLFEVRRDGTVAEVPVGRVGSMPPPPPRDPLITEALLQGRGVSVRDLLDKVQLRSSLLAAIPLVDVQGRAWGVVAIQDVQFIAFHEENLRMLSILGGHVGDLLATDLRSAMDPAGEQFALQLRRALHGVRVSAVPSAVVAVHLGHGRGAELVEPLRSQRRGLDAQWLHTGPDGLPVLLVLMPLADGEAVEGFADRLDRLARAHLDAGLDELGVVIRARVLQPDDSAEEVLTALRGGGMRNETEGPDRRGDVAGAPGLGRHA